MATKKHPLKVIAVLDSETKLCTAFFHELPGLMVQCKEEEIPAKLDHVLDSYIEMLKDRKNNFDIEVKTMDRA